MKMENYNPYSLSGKTILVTGASSGIGKSVAIESSKLGANVVIIGRDKQRLGETFTALFGDNNIQFICDLSNQRDLDELLNIISLLDGVVHCAGITKSIPFSFTNRSVEREIFDINYFAAVDLSRLLIQRKKITKNSSIVFISSVSGTYCSMYGNSVYSATKGAINGIVKGMALDLASKKIRVNAVAPAMVSTNILRDGVFTEEQIKTDMLRYPLKRYGTPDEIAYAVIYLLSDASSWVTGTSLLIDGGYTLL